MPSLDVSYMKNKSILVVNKYLLLCFSFLSILSLQRVQAQEAAAAYEVIEDFNLWQTHKDKEATIFANVAYIRQEPSTKSSLIDSIPVGTAIKFLEDEGLNRTEIRGMNLPWYKISYEINKEKRNGYIWLGLVALDCKKDPKSGNSFLYGISWTNNEQSYDWIEAKVLDKNNQLIQKHGFAHYMGGQSFAHSEFTEDKRLKDTKAIYNIIFAGEACGIPTVTYGYAWDGTNLHSLPKVSSVSDAGVYYYNEELDFPKPTKPGNQLIVKKIEEGEVIDDSKDELEYKIKKSEEHYSWDGKSYQKLN